LATEKNILDIYFRSIGLLVAKFRKEKNLSLEKLGQLIGVDRAVIHRIENGRPITVTTLIKLSLALGKNPKDLLETDVNLGSVELSGLIKSIKPKKKKKALKKATSKK
jgi:transcriptional regulator with XRE-family HTH domain